MTLADPLSDDFVQWLEAFEHRSGDPAVAPKAGDGCRPLYFLASCSAAGFDCDAATLAALAARFAIDPAMLEQAARFLSVVVAEGAPPLRVCHGTNCRISGRAVTSRLLVDSLRTLDPGLSIEPVHCLDHCGEGPNLGCGPTIYEGRTGQTKQDERSWRGRTTSRVISGEDSPPVLD